MTHEEEGRIVNMVGNALAIYRPMAFVTNEKKPTHHFVVALVPRLRWWLWKRFKERHELAAAVAYGLAPTGHTIEVLAMPHGWLW